MEGSVAECVRLLGRVEGREGRWGEECVPSERAVKGGQGVRECFPGAGWVGATSHRGFRRFRSGLVLRLLLGGGGGGQHGEVGAPP
jgi:hypothetical protein